MSFAAGSFGSLVNSLALWAAGAYHFTARLGIRPENWLYPRIVSAWFSVSRHRHQLLYVFPHKTGEGLLGLGLGALTPAFVIAANAI